MKTVLLILFQLSVLLPIVKAQTSDTVILQEVVIDRQQQVKGDIGRLDTIQGTYIYTGKKTEVVSLTEQDAIVTNKIGRSLFAKVPGIFIYDMDGAGNQVNISARGLDAHRGWEFNIRRDGIITNSDMYGYPASHYSMPMESVDKIEIVRGTGALGYGAQFGGMLNYITKEPDTTKKIGFETINTAGSYGLLSTYNAIGGKIGKFSYYAYYNKRVRNGYRKNARTESDAQLVSLKYEPTDKLWFQIEWSRSNYLYRLPGALNDDQFHADPTQATRGRDYYNPDIHVPSIKAGWQYSKMGRISLVSSAVLGDRNSVMYNRPTGVADSINTTTMDYNTRTVNIDRFNSYTTEIRVLQQYHLLGNTSSFAGGVQYMHNHHHRTQLGEGTTGSDFDLSITDAGWGRDIHYRSQNVAIFVQNSFKLHPTLSVEVGGRMEIGRTELTGTAVYLPNDIIPKNVIEHRVPLFGGSIDYRPNGHHNVYAGISQAYRPVVLKDVVPGSTYERTADNLKDAYGFNAEIGYRGNWKFLTWDVTAFMLKYNDRMGTIAYTDDLGDLIILKDNIGNSMTKGIELFVQADFTIAQKLHATIFTSTSYMDAYYQDAVIRNGDDNVNVSGNKVESTPHWISRNGLTLKYWKVSYTVQYSYISDSYADPLNTVEPSASGATGLVPDYGLLDMHISAQITKMISLKASINNITNEQYFTKRPQFYPGPGIWPSDGRNFSVSLGFKI